MAEKEEDDPRGHSKNTFTKGLANGNYQVQNLPWAPALTQNETIRSQAILTLRKDQIEMETVQVWRK